MSARTAEARRLQQREDARRAILVATESLLMEGGADGLSIRRLAERCGYTAPTIYHYFGDKRGLVDTLLEERFTELVDVLDRLPQTDDPADVIRARARAFARFGLKNPVHYRLLTVAREPGADLPPASEAAADFLQRPWEELAEQGRLSIDIETAQRALWATVHGLLTLHSSRTDLEWPGAIFDETIDAMLRGLVREAPPDAKRPEKDRTKPAARPLPRSPRSQ